MLHTRDWTYCQVLCPLMWEVWWKTFLILYIIKAFSFCDYINHYELVKYLAKLSNRKSNETWELVQISPKFQLGKVQKFQKGPKFKK